jgi:hypothetical protein
MATKKITQFSSLAQIDLDSAVDVLPIVDVGAGETKKITAKALTGGAVPDLAATWNDVSTTFSGIKLEITDTASGAGSFLLNLLVGASARFQVTKAGNVSAAGTLSVTGAVTVANSVRSTNATAGIGYSNGAGGVVTQATSRTTGVTLNKICGQITLFAASISGHEADEFVLTNSAIEAGDVVVVSIKSGLAAGTAKYYRVGVTAVAAGVCTISVGNLDNATIPSAGTDTPVLSFAVIKAVAA